MSKRFGQALPAALAVAAIAALATMTYAMPAAAKNQQVELHRADFRVEGASCVTCLRRIASTLRGAKGVSKADVSIYRPYWAIVIYDKKQTNLEQLKLAIKQENVRLADVEDKPINEIPAVIIPKGMSEQMRK